MKLKSKILLFCCALLCIICIFSFSKIQTIIREQSDLNLHYPMDLFDHALNATTQNDDYIAIVTSYTSGPSSASCNNYVTYTIVQLPGATNVSHRPSHLPF